MLWFKAWLETKSRVAFTVIWLAFFVGVLAMAGNRSRAPVPVLDALAGALMMLGFCWIFIPVWLAGSGVRTQVGFGRNATRGVHGSTHFTLSLPVTRARLLLTRGAVGLLQSAAIVIALGIASWVLLPVLRDHATLTDGLQHLLAVFVCGTAFYGLSMLAATLLDDTWHIWSCTLLIMALWAPPVRRLLPPAFDVFRPLVEASPILTHTLPWTAMAVAVAAGGIFALHALKVVESTEY